MDECMFLSNSHDVIGSMSLTKERSGTRSRVDEGAT